MLSRDPWRIGLIAYRRQPRWLTAIWIIGGVLMFASIGVCWFSIVLGIPLLVVSFAAVIAVKYRYDLRHRLRWVRVSAICVDRDMRHDADSDGPGWSARIVCVFQFQGREYRATPEIQYMGDQTLDGLEASLSARIDSQNKCDLFVNPGDPLECVLAGDEWQDRTFFAGK